MPIAPAARVLETLAGCRDLGDLAKAVPRTSPSNPDDAQAWRACAFFVSQWFSRVPDGATIEELHEFLRLARVTHGDGNLNDAGLASIEAQCASRGVR